MDIERLRDKDTICGYEEGYVEEIEPCHSLDRPIQNVHQESGQMIAHNKSTVEGTLSQITFGYVEGSSSFGGVITHGT